MKPITIIAICAATLTLLLIPCATADRCVVTVREAPVLIPVLIPVVTSYNETNLTNVQHFIDNLEPCPWGGACGMHARYFSIEATKMGLDIDETTFIDTDRSRVRRILMSGHRVNMFMDGDVRYYTTNLYAGDTRIVTRPELRDILTEVMESLETVSV